MDVQFSFGPDRSYFLRSATRWACLPEPLMRVLTDSSHPDAMKKPYDVALGMEPGTYSMSWLSAHDERCYEEGQAGPRLATLTQYMKDLGEAGELLTNTVYGPNAGFFATSASGFLWENIPIELEHDIQTRMKKGHPTCVALGVRGTYVALMSHGEFIYNLEDQYPVLEQLLEDVGERSRRKGLSYIALDPFVPNQHYVVFGDGSSLWKVPPAWNEDVLAVSSTIRPAQPIREPGLPELIQASSRFSQARADDRWEYSDQWPKRRPASGTDSRTVDQRTELKNVQSQRPRPSFAKKAQRRSGATPTTSGELRVTFGGPEQTVLSGGRCHSTPVSKGSEEKHLPACPERLREMGDLEQWIWLGLRRSMVALPVIDALGVSPRSWGFCAKLHRSAKSPKPNRQAFMHMNDWLAPRVNDTRENGGAVQDERSTW
ncbi:hypothetical protein BV25DRAFT_1839343 [Artomyces pyxidatus]|uniref:Uncharacterized protein n=1 Tax=Artomyces pyxidatus TaxID=48021 RepID=A0ACB8SXW8_9AGAM|nr:hypothetical protein BV25DRAFT_1839343 [Artomyces pyxidatus]